MARRKTDTEKMGLRISNDTLTKLRNHCLGKHQQLVKIFNESLSTWLKSKHWFLFIKGVMDKPSDDPDATAYQMLHAKYDMMVNSELEETTDKDGKRVVRDVQNDTVIPFESYNWVKKLYECSGGKYAFHLVDSSPLIVNAEACQSPLVFSSFYNFLSQSSFDFIVISNSDIVESKQNHWTSDITVQEINDPTVRKEKSITTGKKLSWL